MDKKASASAGLLLFLITAGLFVSEQTLDPSSDQSELTGAATRRAILARQQQQALQAIEKGQPVVPSPLEEGPTAGTTGLRVLLAKTPQCNDKIINGQETDVDCGGTDCPGCEFAKTCLVDTDCLSKNCLNGKCGLDLCDQGQQRCLGKTLQHCPDARQGWQTKEECSLGCLNGACQQCVSTIGQSCNRNQCGGTGTIQCDGSCSATAPSVPSDLGQACNRNQCGGNGIVLCDGSCSSSAPLVPSNFGQACNRNQCGGNGVVVCDGSCSSGAPFAPSNLGQECNRNQCGGNGVVVCDGSCSSGAPSVPFNLGEACNRNQCGGSGTVQCGGGCSASAPSVPSNLGQECNRNQCGGSGTVQCGGGCSASAPSVPSNLGQSCGCGGSVQCNGQCNKGGCASNQICDAGTCISATIQVPTQPFTPQPFMPPFVFVPPNRPPPISQPSSSCGGLQGCCCFPTTQWPSTCASGLGCRLFNVPGKPLFGVCTLQNSINPPMFIRQGMPPFCGV